jgi:general stress protein 26
MKRTDLPQELHPLVGGTPYVTIASVCPDGSPWNTPVWGYFDDELNLYWASWPNNQHSRNIASNPRIFVVLYDSHAPEGEATGLYMEMTARVLSSKRAIAQGRKVYTTNFGENLTHEPFAGECPGVCIKRSFLGSGAIATGTSAATLLMCDVSLRREPYAGVI